MVKSKKKIKVTKKDFDIEAGFRQFGVLVEHMDSKISLVAEQFSGVNKKLDSHSKILEMHTDMIGKLAVDVEVIKTDIEFIKHGLKRKVDIEEFSALEHRVAMLEKSR